MERCSYTHEELAADLKADLDTKQMNEKFWNWYNEKFHPADLDASLLKSSGDLQDAGDWTQAGDGTGYPGEPAGLPVSDAPVEPAPVEPTSIPEPTPETIVPVVEPVADATAPVDPVAEPAVEAPAEGEQL